jgi:hypothetical protein
VLSGKVTDDSGTALADADVVLKQDACNVATAGTDSAGRYQTVFYPDADEYDFSATWDGSGLER